MKQKIVVFLLTVVISLSMSALWLGWRDQQRIETVRQKLETDLNHLLKTRQSMAISSILQSNPVSERTHVQTQLEDGSTMTESDLGDYLHELITISELSKVMLDKLLWNAEGGIQTIILTTQN